MCIIPYPQPTQWCRILLYCCRQELPTVVQKLRSSSSRSHMSASIEPFPQTCEIQSIPWQCTRHVQKVQVNREIFYAYYGNTVIDLDPLPVSRARLTVVEPALFEWDVFEMAVPILSLANFLVLGDCIWRHCSDCCLDSGMWWKTHISSLVTMESRNSSPSCA